MPARALVGDPAVYNALARGILTGSAVETLFGLQYVKDGETDAIMRFLTAGQDLELKVDTVLRTNSNLDSWPSGILADWTLFQVGSGTAVQDSVIRVGGIGSSVKIECGDVGTAGITRNYTVRASEKLRFSAAMRLLDVDPPALRVSIQNLRTGKYLSSAGLWQTALTYAIPEGSGGINNFTTQAIAFTVEGYAAVQADTCLLKIVCEGESLLGATGAGWFDDVYVIPGNDLLTAHGHNLEPAVSLRARWSDDDLSYTTAATLTPSQPAFYGTWPVEYHRWWKVPYVGVPAAAIFYGEVVLGQAFAATQGQNFGYEVAYTQPQIRSRTSSGRVRVYPRTREGAVPRAVRLDFTHFSDTERDEVLQEWFVRSRGGYWPMVLVLDDQKPEVLHGRLTDKMSVKRLFLQTHSSDVFIEESPFPSIIP